MVKTLQKMIEICEQSKTRKERLQERHQLLTKSENWQAVKAEQEKLITNGYQLKTKNQPQHRLPTHWQTLTLPLALETISNL